MHWQWRKRRRVVQCMATGILLVPLFWPDSIWRGTYLSSQFFYIALSDPLAVLEVTLAGKLIWRPLMWSVIPLVVTSLVLGRFFCGWICPLHTVIEYTTVLKQPKTQQHFNSFLPYWLLSCVLLASAVIGWPVFTTISPIGIVSHAVVFGAGIELALVFIIVSGEWLFDRKAWCRFLCPVGALYGLLGRWKVVRVVVVPSQCNQCGQCQKACSMGAKPGSPELLDAMMCTNCGDCIDACTQQAVKYTWNVANHGGVRNECLESGKR